MDVVAEEGQKADYTLPEGYDDVDAFLKEARERFQQGVDADRENRDAALDDLKFIAGEQWDETVKASRQKKGRPSLEINTLPQYIGQVIGDTRANRPSIKVRPVEDGDVEIAKVRQGLIRFIENQSNATQVYALAGEDQVSCGIGHFRVGLAYANDDTFNQDIRIEHIVNPFAVVWDPASVEPTGADAKFCFVSDDVDRKAFEKEYPDAQSSELEVPLQKEGWTSRDTVRVTEYWLMKETERQIALVQRVPNAEPTIEDVTDDPEGRKLVVKDAAGKPRIRKALRKSACMYLISGKDILEGPFEYQIKRLPIFKVTGREVRVAERRYRFGLIRFAKDAIRMKNLWRSSAAEWLALAPKQQWLLKDTDPARIDRFRKSHASGDTVLEWGGTEKPERLDPPVAPAALLQEALLCDQDIKDVTGLHDASLGKQSNETSGKAILARERQGDTATFMYHDNLAASICEAGKVINDFLPVVFDTARTVTVLGEDDSATPQRINDPNHPQSIDLKTGKYDVVVETGPSYSTKRVEAADAMMQFVQSVPQAAGLIGDLIAKSQDWPDAEAIAERLKKALPPQFQDQEPPKDEQEAQARQMAQRQAQQQQQMAQQSAQLELEERAAKVSETQANAALKMAQAQNAATPQQDGPTDLDMQLKAAQVRQANAMADEAEANAVIASLKIPAAKQGLDTGVVDKMRAVHELERSVETPPQPEPAEPAE